MSEQDKTPVEQTICLNPIHNETICSQNHEQKANDMQIKVDFLYEAYLTVVKQRDELAELIHTQMKNKIDEHKNKLKDKNT